MGRRDTDALLVVDRVLGGPDLHARRRHWPSGEGYRPRRMRGNRPEVRTSSPILDVG